MNSEARREELHSKFWEIPGLAGVYFQPPSEHRMKYPCIRYSYSDNDDLHADDRIYKTMRAYEVIVIDPDPTTEIPDALRENFQYISLDRTYTAENLNHYVFTLYY